MESVAVVVVPIPAQGHLNPLLHLSLHLASRGLPVHFAAPAEHVRQAQARLHGWDEGALRRVEFHELAISEYASPPPDPAASSFNPSHHTSMWAAYFADAPAAVAELLRGISASHRRVVVIDDINNGGFPAKEAARLPNGEGFSYTGSPASSLVAEMDGGRQLLSDVHGLDYLPVHAFVPEEWSEAVSKRTRCYETIPSIAGIIINTSRALEGVFIDFVAEQLAGGGKKVFSFGPVNPMLDAIPAEQGAARHECLDWLDKQPPASVLYISLGSTSTLRGEQIEEFAAALRGSEQRFIWVLRDADRSNVFAESGESRHDKFHSEFAKQTKGTGLLVTEWAPQLEILAHPSTAAFLSHCGWNSTIESMSHGKPILAWPMGSDQPGNAELVCKYLKAGFLVRPCKKHAEPAEVVPAATIQKVIEKMMVSDEGLAVRERAMALGKAVRASMATGGSSQKDIDNFIAHITR